MDVKKQTIAKFKARLEEIKPTLNKRFKTSKELNNHIEKHKKLYEEGKDLYDKIQQLEWELMTPEERKREEEILQLMKQKREGKL